MAKEKKCPLGSVEWPRSDCGKEKCAWWDSLAGLCAVLVIAQFGTEGSFYRHRKEALDRARGG